MLSVDMLSVIKLSVIILIVIMLCVVALNVLEPFMNCLILVFVDKLKNLLSSKCDKGSLCMRDIISKTFYKQLTIRNDIYREKSNIYIECLLGVS